MTNFFSSEVCFNLNDKLHLFREYMIRATGSMKSEIPTESDVSHLELLFFYEIAILTGCQFWYFCDDLLAQSVINDFL